MVDFRLWCLDFRPNKQKQIDIFMNIQTFCKLKICWIFALAKLCWTDCCPKLVCQNSFHEFCLFIKKCFHQTLLIFKLLQTYFLGLVCHAAAWACFPECLVGCRCCRSSSVKPNSRIHIKNLLVDKDGSKFFWLKVSFVNSLQCKNGINYCSSSTFGKVKFDKLSYYLHFLWFVPPVPSRRYEP